MVNIKYYCCWWSLFDLPSLISFIRISAIVAAVRRCWYSFAFASSVDVFVFTDNGCFQHHNVIRVGTSIESDAQYTILMFSIPLHLSCHLWPCITCQLFHFPLRFSSPLVKTTSPNDICISFA